MMRALAALTVAAALTVSAGLVVTVPANAQEMQGMDMGSMRMPAKKATRPAAKPRATAAPTAPRPTRSRAAVGRIERSNRAAAPAKRATAAPIAGMDAGMKGMDHAAMPGMSMPGTADAMPGMDMPGTGPMAGPMPGMAMTGTALAPGDAPAPAAPMDHYADRIYPAAVMQQSRDEMMRESGAQKLHYVLFNLAEYQPRRGRDAFRWDGEAWYGGDIDRLVLKTEGEGRFGAGVGNAEIQALYSRALDPYFDLQAGVRQDLGRGPRRTYATVGVKGVAPYWFEVDGALFLSNKGDLLGRLGGYYDQRITQRLVLQPRIELNLAAQDVRENGIGAGLSTAEFGLRLRYEIKRQFAPYVGVSFERSMGATARFARADGEDVTSNGLVAGVRFWF